MPLLGSAAMLLSFDIAPEAVDEHDRWHTHEHLPERLAIPGFRRGTRWVALEGAPRYMVLYEVADLDVLGSAAYLARLNAPSPWTARMMPHYRGMRRGLCAVVGSAGAGVGGVAALLRFAAVPGAEDGLREGLLADVVPGLPARDGMSGAHLLQGARAAAMTNEQRIRGADAGIDFALVVTGYSRGGVAAAARELASPGGLAGRGAVGVAWVLYAPAASLLAAEAAAAGDPPPQ